jgi:tRNA synthetase class II core domain (G, H, P, S and T)
MLTHTYKYRTSICWHTSDVTVICIANFEHTTMLLLQQCVQQIDLKIKDAIGRLWQCSTVQADFNLPDRFGMEYIASDGTKQQPVMLHRAIFGSVERFFGILVENTAGNFPLWLAPVQVCALYTHFNDRSSITSKRVQSAWNATLSCAAC